MSVSTLHYFLELIYLNDFENYRKNGSMTDQGRDNKMNKKLFFNQVLYFWGMLILRCEIVYISDEMPFFWIN